MPTTDLDQRVKRIAALSDAEVTLLTNEGIMTEDDLKVLQFADLPAAIPVVKRRKLNIIGQYLSCGYIMNGVIDIHSIQTRITPTPVGNANVELRRSIRIEARLRSTLTLYPNSLAMP